VKKIVLLLAIVLIPHITYSSKEAPPKEQAQSLAPRFRPDIPTEHDVAYYEREAPEAQPKEGLAKKLTQKLEEAREELKKKWSQNNGLVAYDTGSPDDDKQFSQCEREMEKCRRVTQHLEQEMARNGIPVPEFQCKSRQLPLRRGVDIRRTPHVAGGRHESESEPDDDTDDE